MNQNQPDYQLLCLRLQCIKLQKKRRQKQNQYIPYGGKQNGNPQQFFKISLCRSWIPISHRLSDDCDKHRSHGNPCQRRQRPDALRHAISCNLASTKERYNTAQRHFHQLKNAVFHSIGNCNPQNTLHESAVTVQKPAPLIRRTLFFMKTKPGDHHSRKGAGQQRRIGHACHTRLQNKYAYQIADNIHHIGYRRQIHGNISSAHTAKQRRAGIVNGQRRIRISGDSKIGNTCLHHIPIYSAEEQ